MELCSVLFRRILREILHCNLPSPGFSGHCAVILAPIMRTLNFAPASASMWEGKSLRNKVPKSCGSYQICSETFLAIFTVWFWRVVFCFAWAVRCCPMMSNDWVTHTPRLHKPVENNVAAHGLLIRIKKQTHITDILKVGTWVLSLLK